MFSQATYGLSTKAPEGGLLQYQYNLNGAETTDDSLVQPMKFNHIRFYQTASFKVSGPALAGGGHPFGSCSQIKHLKPRAVQPVGPRANSYHYDATKH